MMNAGEGIDNKEAVAEVLSSLFYDHICLRILSPTIKF